MNNEISGTVPKSKTFKLISAALMCAIIAILAQIAIPMPSGVPITLQTFAVALCGCMLEIRYSLASVAVYLLLGLVGVPVFSGLQAGPGRLFGPTGGFLWGFLIFAFFCSLSSKYMDRNKDRFQSQSAEHNKDAFQVQSMEQKKDDFQNQSVEQNINNRQNRSMGRSMGQYRDRVIRVVLCLAGLAICHICGVLQYSFVTQNGILPSFVIVSLPYLIKDIASVILAILIADRIRPILMRLS